MHRTVVAAAALVAAALVLPARHAAAQDTTQHKTAPHAVRDAAHKVGRTSSHLAKEGAQGVKKGADATGDAVSTGAKATGDAVSTGAKATAHAGKKAGKYVKARVTPHHDSTKP